MLNMAKSLCAAGAVVHQFALNTQKHHVDTTTLPELFHGLLHFSCADIDTRIKPGAAIRNLFTKDSYNVSRFYSEDAQSALIEILKKEDFDVVQLETLFTAPYIPAIRNYSKAKISLRAHNAEHIIWERLAKYEKKFLRKKYLEFLSRRLKNYELSVLGQIDFLVPITPVDEAIFQELGYRNPILSLPLGVDLSDYPYNFQSMPSLVPFHLGSMDWLPNVEGVEWFLKSCWPLIHKTFPDLNLHLAGRSFPEHILQANHPGVICQGRIENANAYMADKQIMIVPLLSGSGMRVKIIQGLALGKTIISTRIGAEGIHVQSGKNILLADTPEEFLTAMKYCLELPHKCMDIGRSARALAEEEYSNLTIGKKLLAFYSTT